MSSAPPPVPTRRERTFWWLSLLLASCVLVATLWSVDYLPTHDGPEHVLTGHIENHYDDPGTIYSRHLEPAPQFAARGFAALFVPLEGALGWRSALRAAQSVIVLALAWAFVALVVAIDPARRWTALAGFAFALPWPLYMGFFSYVLGVALGVALVAYALRSPLERLLHWLPLLIGSALQASAHLFSALLTSCMLAALLVAGSAPRDRLRRFAGVVLTSLPAGIVLLLAARDRGSYLDIPTADATTWPPFGTWLASLPGLLFPGPRWRAALGVALLAAALIACFARWRALARRERALAGIALGFCLLGTVAPLHVPGWQFFNPRFTVLGTTLALALLPTERWRTQRVVVPIAACGIAFVCLFGSGYFHRELARGCAPALSGLERDLSRSGVQLPLTIDPYCGVAADPGESRVPYLAPLRHVAALYAAEHGGTIPILFIGSPSIHAFVPKEHDDELPMPQMWALSESERRNPDVRALALDYFAMHAFYYESLMVFGTEPRDIAQLRARGFVADIPADAPGDGTGNAMGAASGNAMGAASGNATGAASGNASDAVFIGRARGCPVTLRIEGAPPGSVAFVEHGPSRVGAGLWRRAVELKPAKDGADGAAKAAADVKLEHSVCGPAWVRVVVRPPQGAPRRCSRAAPDARLMYEAKGEGTGVRCEVGGG